jgi:hypothetical protein
MSTWPKPKNLNKVEVRPHSETVTPNVCCRSHVSAQGGRSVWPPMAMLRAGRPCSDAVSGKHGGHGGYVCRSCAHSASHSASPFGATTCRRVLSVSVHASTINRKENCGVNRRALGGWRKTCIFQPVEYLVRIQCITPRNLCNRNARCYRLLTNRALVFITPGTPLSTRHTKTLNVHLSISGHCRATGCRVRWGRPDAHRQSIHNVGRVQLPLNPYLQTFATELVDNIQSSESPPVISSMIYKVI